MRRTAYDRTGGTLMNASRSRRRRSLAPAKPGRNLLADERGQDFTARCHDFLADNDELRVDCRCRHRAGDRVVIGHDQSIQPLGSGSPNKRIRTGERVTRIQRVAVEFDGDSHLPKF
jgi:hypothetical protein